MIIAGSLPRDTYGFTYKGLHSGRDFDLWLTKSPIDFLVESLDALEDRPGTAGSYDFGGQLGVREIEFNLVLRANDESDLRAKRRAISSWLSPAKGLGELWWDTEPDKMYYARRFGSAQALNQNARQGEFSLSMVAPDPYAYSRTEGPLNITSAGDYNLDNLGNEEAAPVITIEGTNTSGKVDITFGGKTFTYDGPLSTGDRVTVYTDDMTAYKVNSVGERSNVLNDTNNVFPVLPLGANNVNIAVTTDFTISNITIDPESRWI